jgi:hypothetical protein
MRFLALASSVDAYFEALDPGRAAAEARAEARRTWELYLSGVICEIHFRTDRRDAVIVLEAADEAAAREALATLPYVRAGGLTFEVIGLRPYDGWARLLADDAE